MPVVTVVTNECECVESGECTCPIDWCACECGCEECTQEYISDIADEYQCACGGNCACGANGGSS